MDPDKTAPTPVCQKATKPKLKADKFYCDWHFNGLLAVFTVSPVGT